MKIGIIGGSGLYDIEGLEVGAEEVTIRVTANDGARRTFVARVRIDTPKEWDYYVHDGILHFVLRQLVSNRQRAA